MCVCFGRNRRGWCHQLWKYYLLFIVYVRFSLQISKQIAHISWNIICANKKHMVRVDLLNRSGYHFQHINFNNFMDRLIQHEDMYWMWNIAFKRNPLSIVHFRHFLSHTEQRKKQLRFAVRIFGYSYTVILCLFNKYFENSMKKKLPSRRKE